MSKVFSSQGAPLIPPASQRESIESDGVQHELPFLAPLSHAHPHLSPSNPASSWDPDAFLLSRLPVPLDELRSELRTYLATLKEELVGVINDDYEDFVGLGTGLKGEGKRLERLTGPLGCLKEDVEVIRSSLVANEEAVQSKLSERAQLRDEKNLLQLLLDLTDSLTRTETLLSLTPPSSSSSTAMAPSTSSTTKPEGSSGAAALSTHGEEKLVARVASEYTRVLYLADKASKEGCIIVAEVGWRIERIRNTLNGDLDHLFSETLSSLSSTHASTDKIRTTLTECLKTYQLIGGWRDAEDLFRREMVRPIVRKIVSADALHESTSPSIPQTPYMGTKSNPFSPDLSARPPPTPISATPADVGHPSQAEINPFDLTPLPTAVPTRDLIQDDSSPLAGLLNRLLRDLDKECGVILDVAERLRKVDRRAGGGGLEESMLLERLPSHNSTSNKGQANGRNASTAPEGIQSEDGEGFELFGNVIWREVGDRLMDELGSVIFAAGRPDELHYHYSLLRTFLDHFEATLAPSLPALLHMRSTATYRTFSSRWQLPVYFQLRFKAIVVELEEGLRKGSSAGKGGGFELKESALTLNALEGCWKEDVYIGEISWRFWRLSLQIISRYRTWIDTIVSPLEPPMSLPSASFNPPSSLSATPRQFRTPSASGRSTPLPTMSSSTANNQTTTSELPALSTDPAVLAEEERKLRTACAVMGDLGRLEGAVWGVWRRRIKGCLDEDKWEDDDDDDDYGYEEEDGEHESRGQGKSAEATLTSALHSLNHTYLPPLTNLIITHLTRHCSEPLRLIRSISSQYRSTANNKSKSPSEPSYWVAGVWEPIKEFFKDGAGVGKGLKEEWGTEIGKAVVKAVLQRYISTLLSIRSQESSLKRYRSSKPKTSSAFSLFSSSSASSAAAAAAAADQEKRDEENVKKQYTLDVGGLREGAKRLGLGLGEDGVEEGWDEARAVASDEGPTFAAGEVGDASSHTT